MSRANEKIIWNRINNYSKKLKFGNVEENILIYEKENGDKEINPRHMLASILESEVEHKTSRKIERSLRLSRLPLEKNKETFEFNRLPLTLKRRVDVLLQGDFINRKENVLAFGQPGSGKTHLLCAIAQEQIFNGKTVIFYSCSLLVQELLIAKREFSLPKAIKKIGKFDLLILDDIGYVQQNKDEIEVLFTLLAERYERGSVMITSNLPFSKWEKIFKDPMTTAAAIDRLVHHSVLLELNVSSYRTMKAKEKR